LNDVRGCLNQFNQNAFTAEWKFIIAFGVDKNNIVASGTFPNPAGGKTQAFAAKPVMG
jgi:hypothetical protein